MILEIDLVKYLLARGAKIECHAPNGTINKITEYYDSNISNILCKSSSAYMQLLFDLMKSYSELNVVHTNISACAKTREEKLKEIDSKLMDDEYKSAKKFTDDDLSAL